MKKKTSSTNSVWFRHLGLALVLIIIATVVINLETIRSSSPVPEGQKPKRNPATGLSDFYAQYRSGPSQLSLDNTSDFVMPVKTDEEPLEQRLQNMESLQRSVTGRWVGEHRYRTFKAGGTLREVITAYAQAEGMQLLWELNQDFVVKSSFQIEDTIAGALGQIATAVDSNFNGTVEAFFCPRQRTFVITARVNDYLRQYCSPVRAGQRG
ncbi:TcpQ domain-containing protein [Lacimicrobium sp. SS2-24]|uniref:TcpQ domain-containing protein n=1 Tax=Lacimicrobium sp. SS2-24 TaxID=2005569 RepID=UPI000B4B4C65|nr:TcpQ domain-containing protein [Lacimicrobium sp. SS2-24]